MLLIGTNKWHHLFQQMATTDYRSCDHFTIIFLHINFFTKCSFFRKIFYSAIIFKIDDRKQIGFQNYYCLQITQNKEQGYKLLLCLFR